MTNKDNLRGTLIDSALAVSLILLFALVLPMPWASALFQTSLKWVLMSVLLLVMAIPYHARGSLPTRMGRTA